MILLLFLNPKSLCEIHVFIVVCMRYLLTTKISALRTLSFPRFAMLGQPGFAFYLCASIDRILLRRIFFYVGWLTLMYG